jgi:hypothetical protein
MNSNERLTRRQLLGVTVTTAAGLAGYVHDVKLVDPKKSSTFKPGQHCANCLQITGKDGDTWRPCNIFPKKLVNANGWCSVWAKKPGTA